MKLRGKNVYRIWLASGLILIRQVHNRHQPQKNMYRVTSFRLNSSWLITSTNETNVKVFTIITAYNLPIKMVDRHRRVSRNCEITLVVEVIK